MKFCNIKIALAALTAAAILPTSCVSKQHDGWRGSIRGSGTTKAAARTARMLQPYELTRECTVLVRESINDDFSEVESFDCELHPADADGVDGITVAIEDGESSLTGINVESGLTTVFAPNSFLSNGKLTLGNEITEGSVNRGRSESIFKRRLATTGDRTLLVVIVNTSDGKSVRFSPERISDSLFGNGVDGNGADAVTLKSQYAKCSGDKLQFKPCAWSRSGSSPIANGVVTVDVDRPSTDDDGLIRFSAEGELFGLFGINPLYVANHIMFCLPDEVDMGIGYANINGPISVLRDDWCTYVSLQLHEMGHNLGLGHSGEGENSYGDRSGVMGASFEEDNTEMCFNNAKNWQLGWFSDRQMSINVNSVDYWSGELVGVVDYASSRPDQYVVLKIATNLLPHDYYVGYNKKSSFNSGTKEAGNQVTVQTRSRGSSSKSWLVAKLSEGESFSVPDFFALTVDDIDSRGAKVTFLGPRAELLCDPMRDLINGEEVCLNTDEVCEATADLGANGKESCDAWCERSGLECVLAWDDGRADCEKTSSISCGKTGNSRSICRCEKVSAPRSPPPTRNSSPPPTRKPTKNPTVPPTPLPSKKPTKNPTRNPTAQPTPPPVSSNLCTPMLDLIANDEVCVNSNEVCEATANLGANGKESCNAWCERSGLECMQAWNDGSRSCEKASSISCGTADNNYSICRCEKPRGLCRPYLGRIWDDEVCSDTPKECEATADLAQNGNESCDDWCERYGLRCTRAWNDGDFCERTSEISCVTNGKARSICLCEP